MVWLVITRITSVKVALVPGSVKVPEPSATTWHEPENVPLVGKGAVTFIFPEIAVVVAVFKAIGYLANTAALVYTIDAAIAPTVMFPP